MSQFLQPYGAIPAHRRAAERTALQHDLVGQELQHMTHAMYSEHPWREQPPVHPWPPIGPPPLGPKPVPDEENYGGMVLDRIRERIKRYADTGVEGPTLKRLKKKAEDLRGFLIPHLLSVALGDAVDLAPPKKKTTKQKQDWAMNFMRLFTLCRMGWEGLLKKLRAHGAAAAKAPGGASSAAVKSFLSTVDYFESQLRANGLIK